MVIFVALWVKMSFHEEFQLHLWLLNFNSLYTTSKCHTLLLWVYQFGTLNFVNCNVPVAGKVDMKKKKQDKNPSDYIQGNVCTTNFAGRLLTWLSVRHFYPVCYEKGHFYSLRYERGYFYSLCYGKTPCLVSVLQKTPLLLTVVRNTAF